jgi:hypothetical protein
MIAIPLGSVGAVMRLGSRAVFLLVPFEQAVSLSKASPPYPSPRLSELVTCSIS